MARDAGRPPAPDCNRLWAMSGGRCAFPECEQPLVERVASQWVTQGEIAHIHAHSQGGPRFDGTLSVHDRDAYENTLLLCRRHHKLIDADPAAYPADVIREWKERHESRYGQAALQQVLESGLLSPAPYPERYVRRAQLAATVLERAAAGPVALSGVSGSGKTTLAREVFDLAAEVNFRFWVRGHDELTLLGDLAALGVFFDLPLPAEISAHAVEPILALLAERPDWLVVIDDVRDAQVLRHMPRGGRVLVTTQYATLPSLDVVSIEPMGDAECHAVLITSPHLANSDESTLQRLSELSDGLPLAVGQIAAYSEATGIPAEAHLALLAERRAELLARGDLLHHGTFTASIELTLPRLTDDGRALLGVLCSAADAPIPLPHPVAPEQPLSVLQDRLRFEEAAADLRRFSLITRSGDTFRVHPLVRDVVRHLQLDDQPLHELCAVALLANQAPEWSDRADGWPVMQALEPHLLLLLEQQFGVHAAMSAFAANKLGPYLSARGRPEASRQVLERALEGLHDGVTEDQGWRGSLLQNLANTLAHLGDFAAAETAMREALELKTVAYGPQSRLTGLAHAGLGSLLSSAGRHEEALVAHEHALEVYTYLGDAELMADALYDIAFVLDDDDEQTEEHLKRAQALAEAEPGAWTVLSYVLLARSGVAEQREDWGEAIALAVAAAEAAAAHADASPQLAAAQGAHGRLLWHVGEVEDSLSMLRRAYDTYCATGDLGSAAAARAQGNLGYYGLLSGMPPREAVRHLQESLAALQASLPAGHSSIDRAETMLTQALDLLERDVT